MSLRRSLRVLSPCDLDYGEMRRESEQRRFCEACEKSVHELRTVQDAERALSVANQRGESICVRYAVDDEGNPSLARRRRRTRRSTMAAPAFVLAVGLAAMVGCTAENGRAPNLIYAGQCVYDSPIYHFTLERGEGNCPAVEPEIDKVEIHYDDHVVPLADVGTPTKKPQREADDEQGTFTYTGVMGVIAAPADGELQLLDLGFDAPDVDALLEPPEPQPRVRLGRMTIKDQDSGEDSDD